MECVSAFEQADPGQVLIRVQSIVRLHISWFRARRLAAKDLY